jgi:hypothetical protein
MKFIAIAGLLALAGCAQQWVREGSSAEDLYRESAQCRADAMAAAGGAYLLMRAIDEKCMQGKGWHAK